MQLNRNLTGKDFHEMFAVATDWLEKSVAEVNALNVFPVPDGDTGTNMLLTMHSALDEVKDPANATVAEVSKSMSRGALMGARGNSGVILSQIIAGISRGLEHQETCDGQCIATAFEQASITAYKGISNPVEGTILTVIKDVAKAAKTKTLNGTSDIVAIMEEVVTAAGESVANTPTLLKVLREAGVVDAGGQGLCIILDGALRYLKGEADAMQFRKPQIIPSRIPLTPHSITSPESICDDEIPFGYCTNLLIKGQMLDVEKITDKLKKRGESLVVVGDDKTIRIHIHTLDPGWVISYLTTLGTLDNVHIQNMDEQHEDFIEMQKDKSPSGSISMVAVVAGDGFAEVFSSLGVSHIVPGGQTMNPSTKDIYQAVEKCTGENVIILPNNKNIILSAEQVQKLTKKKVLVVPTKTMPQGIAALLSFDYDADFETNHKLMSEALNSVKTIEVTRAVRSTQVNGLDIKKKQFISILDGQIISASNDLLDSLNWALEYFDTPEAEVVTIYYGEGEDESGAESVSASIAAKFPHLQFEIIKGGQRHYNYILSLE
ncbi:MAG: DAK2 domain-containing protein [Dehalococcoidales bacterium]|jgi:DAK2 domain fusion protein YloV|nr:DAK2 domain-containing protein [Dehalococcoidales bacterium]MDD3264606.1 DAK2 domain-containing protein [Dehalococcoidales bacterium]MDD4322091.1 DAK2 domain-containing protein [Dehalococcoidales bacterium]MDD4793662.1 DAK2 domain-containing protein [Dehalococcoidales bacterium]MDD5497855.1 DAK2 domain-containing protein [Dehalococcoidales bacterium]